MTDVKLCTMWNELKSLDEYHKHIRKPLGLNSQCIECRKYSKHEHYKKKKTNKQKKNKKKQKQKQKQKKKKQNKDRYKDCYPEFIQKNPNYKNIKRNNFIIHIVS